jgi:hypothetical protein
MYPGLPRFAFWTAKKADIHQHFIDPSDLRAFALAKRLT